jgi:hypothetical protein
MAENLVQRVRFTVGSDNDDFFRPDAIVNYLNAAQHKVVSYLIRTETEAKSGKTLRALDKLRSRFTQNITTPSTYGSYQYVDIEPNDTTVDPDWDRDTDPVTNVDDIQEILYLSLTDTDLNKKIRCKELTSQRLFMLDWGNIKPSSFEAYYFVTGGGTKIRLFGADLDVTDTVDFTYIKRPSLLTEASDSVSIASQFTNAVIYGASIMMAVQEQRGNVNDMMELYKKELERNAY